MCALRSSYAAREEKKERERERSHGRRKRAQRTRNAGAKKYFPSRLALLDAPVSHFAEYALTRTQRAHM